MRKCKYCGEEKDLEAFVKGTNGNYRYRCKECKNKARRTGVISSTRFQVGHALGKRFEAGHTPWYKVKGLPAPSKGKGRSVTKNSVKTKDWTVAVKERDGWKCVKCGSKDRLSAHHIIPWKIDETKRFDVSNGIALCNSCHGKEEGFKKGHIPWTKGTKGLLPTPWNKGKKASIEIREKISKAKIGKPSGNKGKKASEEAKEKMRQAKLGKPSNRTKAKRELINVKAD